MFNNPYNMYPYMNVPIRGAMQTGFNMAPATNMAGVTNMAKTASKTGFFKSLSTIKWGEVLTNTQKTLNVINQAIPVYYQIKPIYNNLRSFGKIMSAFNEPNEETTTTNNNSVQINNNNQANSKDIEKENSNKPTFFIS